MTDWALENSNEEKAMPENQEWVRDFFAMHEKAFADDRDRATFRRYLEEYRIRETEAPVFMTVYLQGPDQMQSYVNKRWKTGEEIVKKETTEKTKEQPIILPFKKQEEEAPKPETEHKTAA